MSKNLIALIFAAGLGALTYSQLGKRIGYSDTKRVWTIIGIVFVLAYIVILMTLTWVIPVK